jgi:hypothetical protein
MSGAGNREIIRHCIFIILLLLSFAQVVAQPSSKPDFTWGNSAYFNLNKGESINFENTEIKLLSVHGQFNQLKVGNDTVNCRVSRRTLPVVKGELRIFVADNFNVKLKSANNAGHTLLKKDAMICVSKASLPLLNEFDFIFPISFNDGYLWSCEEDSYLYSIQYKDKNSIKNCIEGVDFDLQNSKGTEKNLVVAVENSFVEWIYSEDGNKNEASILLKSSSQSSVFYLYQHLDSKKLEVRKGQMLEKGDLIGPVFYEGSWAHLTFSVIYSEQLPEAGLCEDKIVNGFPQIYELHYNSTASFYKSFKKGRIFFGKNSSINGNQKNASEFENYTGKGWNTGEWNISEKVETVSKGTEGNVRLKKVIFENTKAKAENPKNYFEYEIQVPVGNYRIRAKVGDVELPSWQKVVFEGVETNAIATEKGQFSWTSERIVKVSDGRLTLRIYYDESNNKVAGISEIVFQVAG